LWAKVTGANRRVRQHGSLEFSWVFVIALGSMSHAPAHSIADNPTLASVDLLLNVARSRSTPYYREFPPAPDLRAFVACTWVHLVRFAGETPLHAILPDGCADIMIYDDQPPRVAGPDAITRHVELRHGLVITGIRLRPGAWHAVLRCPATTLVNGSCLLSDLVADGRRLGHRLVSAMSHATRIAELEAWVRAASTRATARDRAVVGACRVLSEHSHIAIGDIAAQLGWNARMVHRQFTASCGYSPKHFQRIMRMQTFLRGLRAGRTSSLSSLAIAAGYSDQAHMTRDFRAITGFTPTAYLASGGTPGWGAWITEDWTEN
jgi:AraC-like DNA-binding protein